MQTPFLSPRPVAAAPADEVRARYGPAALAGAIAALAMIAAQLIWRVAGDSGAPAFAEQIVAAVARLTPLDTFGEITETYGGAAKRTLFIAVLLATVGAGALAGRAAARLAARFAGGTAGFGQRLLAGLVVAGGLLAVAGLVVLPIGYYGTFGADSQYASDIRLQMATTFGLWAVAWATLAVPDPERATAGDDTIDRRTFARAALGPAGAVAAIAAAVPAWRIIAPETVDSESSRAAAERIAQRAQGGPLQNAQDGMAPTEAPATPDPSLPDAAAELAALDAAGEITPLVTATADFYNVSKNVVDPTVSADGWTLTINGLVFNEARFTLEQLTALATTVNITTLACISNELNGRLISTAEWQGVPLVTLLARAGVRPEAIDLRIRAADDYEDSIPVSVALDPDTLLVVGMNGEPLPDKHGYPARLIVPGIYGMKNVKWVEEISLVAVDFQGYWQTRGWSDPAPTQIWARVDQPTGGETGGPVTVAGVAAAVKRGIDRVELTTDDGATWVDAYLEPELNGGFTWRRWAAVLDLAPGGYTVRVRCTDGDGVVAPETERPPLPDGATGWPSRSFSVTSGEA